MSDEQAFTWGITGQPPMSEIMGAVAELSGGTVAMAMPFSDSATLYKLVISRGNGPCPAVYARFVHTSYPQVPDSDIAAAWRSATPAETAFWRGLEAAASDARPGPACWVLVKGYHDSGAIDHVFGPHSEAHVDWLLSTLLEYSSANWTKVKLSSGPEEA